MVILVLRKNVSFLRLHVLLLLFCVCVLLLLLLFCVLLFVCVCFLLLFPLFFSSHCFEFDYFSRMQTKLSWPSSSRWDVWYTKARTATPTRSAGALRHLSYTRQSPAGLCAWRLSSLNSWRTTASATGCRTLWGRSGSTIGSGTLGTGLYLGTGIGALPCLCGALKILVRWVAEMVFFFGFFIHACENLPLFCCCFLLLVLLSMVLLL